MPSVKANAAKLTTAPIQVGVDLVRKNFDYERNALV